MIDSMSWAAYVSVEMPDGTITELKGTSTNYARAEGHMEVMLHTIRELNPDAVIVDCYYISRNLTQREARARLTEDRTGIITHA